MKAHTVIALTFKQNFFIDIHVLWVHSVYIYVYKDRDIFKNKSSLIFCISQIILCI